MKLNRKFILLNIVLCIVMILSVELFIFSHYINYNALAEEQIDLNIETK